LHEQERDAAVAVLRVGAREHEDPIGPRPEGSPNLLTVDDEFVAFEAGARLEGSEIAPGARLTEALAPDLVSRQHRRQEAAALLFRAVMDEGWTAKPDAEEVDDRGGVGARHFRF